MESQPAPRFLFLPFHSSLPMLGSSWLFCAVSRKKGSPTQNILLGEIDDPQQHGMAVAPEEIAVCALAEVGESHSEP